MKVLINGKEQEILQATVFPAPYNKKEKCNYVTFSQETKSEIKIITDEKIEKLVIRPLSAKVNFSYEENTITIPEMGNLNSSVEYNDKCILVFASQKKEYKAEGKVIRFEKGRHDIGKMTFTEDNLTVILDEGAYLDGKFEFNGCKNLKICGLGVLSNLSYRFGTHRVLCDLLACENVVVEDITLTDSVFWVMRVFGCENVKINNVKIVSGDGNNDGFDICGSRNVEVKHCFTRTWDDSLVVKSFDDRDKTSVHVVFKDSGTDMTKAFEKIGNCEHIYFSDCVLWNDFARPIELGVSMRCDKIFDVHFENIDIIRSTTGYPLMGSQHGARAEISNISFENIRIEDCPGAQLFDFRITSSCWNTDTKKGSMHDFYFKDIKFVGKPGIDFLPEMSRIQGYSEENTIENFIFEDIDLLGMFPNSPDELNLVLNEYTKNIVVKSSKANMNMVKTEVDIGELTLKDGKYEGIVTTKIINLSEKETKGNVWLEISPKNTAIKSTDRVYYKIGAKESTEFETKVTLLPGKSVIRVQADSLNVISDWKLIENPLVLTKEMEKFEFVNYYGIKKEIYLSADETGINIKATDNGKLTIYSAKAVPVQIGEVLFTVEETDFAESMAVCMGKNGEHVIAPELRCPAEIWYVFNNMPKVEKIFKNEIEEQNDIHISYEKLGAKENLILELVMDIPETEKLRYPLSLFHSVTPDQSCHMFAKVVVK